MHDLNVLGYQEIVFDIHHKYLKLLHMAQKNDIEKYYTQRSQNLWEHL